MVESILHYQLVNKLGEGAMGTVYRALDKRLERPVALKFIADNFTFDSKINQRFLIEAKAAAQLDHPNIGTVYTVEETDERMFIVMALYEGEVLRERIDRTRGEGIPVEMALDITLQIAKGLAAAHAKEIIHRDIKPGNIFVTHSGLVKILDFGIAKLTCDDKLTRAGEIIGTLDYMSPEAVRGQTVDPRTDLWALGAVFYEMLRGTPPFKGAGSFAAAILRILSNEPEPLTLSRPDVPPVVMKVIDKLLEKDRDDRYGSAKDLIADLEAIRGGDYTLHNLSGTQVGRGDEPTLVPNDPTRVGTPPTTPMHVLPTVSAPLLGRHDELRIIELHLANPHCRILSLLAIGGTGKTRLSIEAGRRLLESGKFRDGVYFIELDALTDAAAIPSTIAHTLGMKLEGSSDILTQLEHYLENKQALLILDNYEHLMDAATLPADLVNACHDLRILVTSRERLQLEEEWVLPMQGLPTPPQTLQDLTEAEKYESVQLFLRRAKRVSIGYELEPADLPHLIRILERVEGSPLATELAAAWVKIMPIEEIAEELERSLDLLETRTRNVSERHRSIRAVFEHSWGLLSKREQAALERLAVFRGGFRKESAAAVAGVNLNSLADLVDKSLLRINDEGRYSFHPLLYGYAFEKLEASGGEGELEAKHSDYYLHFLQEREDAMWGSKQKEVLDAVDAELENIRTAWLNGVKREELEGLLGAAEPLMVYCEYRNRYEEGIGFFGGAIKQFLEDNTNHQRILASVMALQAWLYARLGSYEKGMPLAAEALAKAHTLAYPQGILQSKAALAANALFTGDFSSVRRSCEAYLEAARTQEDDKHIMIALNALANLEAALGNLLEARTLLQDALLLNRQFGNPANVALTLNNLGHLLLLSGKPQEAQSLLEEGLQLAQKVSYQHVLSPLLQSLAMTYLQLGNLVKADEVAKESLAIAINTRQPSVEAAAYYILGQVQLAQNKLPAAQTQLSRSLALAWKIQEIPRVFHVLAAIAQLHLAKGEAQSASSLATLILDHPAADQLAKSQSEALAVHHETHEPQSLDDVVRHLLETLASKRQKVS